MAKDFPTLTLETSLISLFLDTGIKSIVFRKGTGLHEFLTFLNAFVHKFWEAKDGKEINRRLKEAQVRSIGVGEIGDVAVPEVEPGAPEPARRVGDVLEALENVADPEVRLQIVRKLLDQDPLVLERAKSESLAPGQADKLPGLLPLEKGRECVGVLLGLLRAAPEELRPRIRQVGHLVIDAFRHDPRLSALLRQFLASGGEELTPLWMTEQFPVKADDPGPVARSKALLALPAEERTRPLLEESVPLIRDLLTLSRTELAARLLACLTGLLTDREPAHRRAAAHALHDLQAAWENPALTAAREGFEALLCSSLDKEQEAETYGKLADLAVLLADGRLRREEPDRALETLSLFHRHQSAAGSLAFREAVATRGLEQIAASSGFTALLSRVRAGEAVALRVVEALGIAAAPSLVEEMKRIEAASSRAPLAATLAKIGPKAVTVLTDEIARCTTPSDALRLLEMVPESASEEAAVASLGAMLRHSSAPVRSRAASILADRAYPRAGDFLLEALKEEKDVAIRVALVEGLGKLRASSAFPALAELADSRSEAEEVRGAACMSLARLGHPEAVPILTSLASKGSRLATLLKPNNPAVRAAAIRALGLFPTNAAARETLKKALEDSDPNLQATARETLHRPVQKALATLGREAQQASPDVKPGNVKLAGSVQEIPIDQICQLVGGSEKTGLLMLSLEGRVARIYFDRGNVVSAEFERLQDQLAINAIVKQKKGDFIFQPGEKAPQRRIQSPIHLLLLEAFRVHDEGKK